MRLCKEKKRWKIKCFIRNQLISNIYFPYTCKTSFTAWHIAGIKISKEFHTFLLIDGADFVLEEKSGREINLFTVTIREDNL